MAKNRNSNGIGRREKFFRKGKLGKISTVSKPIHSVDLTKYVKPANEVYEILNLRRQDVFKYLDQLRKYLSVAKNYSQELLKNHLEELHGAQSDDKYYNTIHTDINIPKTKLTKNGDICEPILKRTIEQLSQTFNVEDNIPIMLGGDLIKQLIRAPKKIVAETHFNAIGKHDRPCYVIRRLLECTINEKKYLLMADEKYYQNSPTVAYPLTLIACGEATLPCQISRIDSVGHLGKSTIEMLGLTDKTDIIIPDYLQEKFDSNHHNALPSKKGNKRGRFSNIKQVSATHHIHERDANFELTFALSHLSKFTIYKTEPTKFLSHNAHEIKVDSYYVDDSTTKKYCTPAEYFELMQKSMTLQSEDVLKNNAVISTERLQQYFAKTYNITNYTPDPQLAQFLDELRTFKPDRQNILIVNDSKTKKPYPVFSVDSHHKLELEVKKIVGRFCDFDYVKVNRPDLLEYYRSKIEAVKQGEQKTTPVQTNQSPNSGQTPDGGLKK